MFETTTTYTRPDTSKDFFVFQTDDVELLKIYTNFRKEMSNSPGFIGMSYFMSQDNLKLRVQVLWESESLATNFFNVTRFRGAYLDHINGYNIKNQIIGTVESTNTFDPKYLKDKKLSTRLTVKEAQDRLIDFLSNQQ
jgi:heme-degrading monooxygenase HmoA